jgi:hypothetical protein
MDTVRQVQDSLTKMQTAIDELMVTLAEQQRQLLAANAALDTLIAQLAAMQPGDDGLPPVIPSVVLRLVGLLSALLGARMRAP